MAQARVIEARGFRGVAIRAMLNGVTLLARTRYPVKVFDEVPEAAAWLATVMPTVAGVTLPTAAQIVELVDIARGGLLRI
jgi:hypothetical protein